jgi:hypothetical protein
VVIRLPMGGMPINCCWEIHSRPNPLTSETFAYSAPGAFTIASSSASLSRSGQRYVYTKFGKDAALEQRVGSDQYRRASWTRGRIAQVEGANAGGTCTVRLDSRAGPHPRDGFRGEPDTPPQRLGGRGPGEPGGQEARAESIPSPRGINHPRRRRGHARPYTVRVGV